MIGDQNSGNNDSLSYYDLSILAQQKNSFSGKKYEDLRFLIPISNIF